MSRPPAIFPLTNTFHQALNKRLSGVVFDNFVKPQGRMGSEESLEHLGKLAELSSALNIAGLLWALAVPLLTGLINI